MGLFGKMKKKASKLGRKLAHAKKIGQKGLHDASSAMHKGAELAHKGSNILGDIDKGITKLEKNPIGGAILTAVPGASALAGSAQQLARRGKSGLDVAEEGLAIGSGLATAGAHGNIHKARSGIEKAVAFKKKHINVH